MKFVPVPFAKEKTAMILKIIRDSFVRAKENRKLTEIERDHPDRHG